MAEQSFEYAAARAQSDTEREQSETAHAAQREQSETEYAAERVLSAAERQEDLSARMSELLEASDARVSELERALEEAFPHLTPYIRNFHTSHPHKLTPYTLHRKLNFDPAPYTLDPNPST